MTVCIVSTLLNPVIPAACPARSIKNIAATINAIIRSGPPPRSNPATTAAKSNPSFKKSRITPQKPKGMLGQAIIWRGASCLGLLLWGNLHR